MIPESITCFVLPAHETVTMLTEQAKQILKQWGGTGFYADKNSVDKFSGICCICVGV